MSRVVKAGLVQCSNPLNDETSSIAEIKDAALKKHLPFVEAAGNAGVQTLCLQEIFNGPYFCPSQDKRWYDAAESIPGPTTEELEPYARKHEMVIVVPLFEGFLRATVVHWSPKDRPTDTRRRPQRPAQDLATRFVPIAFIAIIDPKKEKCDL